MMEPNCGPRFVHLQSQQTTNYFKVWQPKTDVATQGCHKNKNKPSSSCFTYLLSLEQDLLVSWLNMAAGPLGSIPTFLGKRKGNFREQRVSSMILESLALLFENGSPAQGPLLKSHYKELGRVTTSGCKMAKHWSSWLEAYMCIAQEASGEGTEGGVYGSLPYRFFSYFVEVYFV